MHSFLIRYCALFMHLRCSPGQLLLRRALVRSRKSNPAWNVRVQGDLCPARGCLLLKKEKTPQGFGRKHKNSLFWGSEHPCTRVANLPSTLNPLPIPCPALGATSVNLAAQSDLHDPIPQPLQGFSFTPNISFYLEPPCAQPFPSHIPRGFFLGDPGRHPHPRQGQKLLESSSRS